MFRLQSIEISDHSNPVLNGLFPLFDQEDKGGPFITIVIGPNGTGKSLLLKCISDILRGIDLEKNGEDESSFGYKYELSYLIDGEEVWICSDKKYRKSDNTKEEEDSKLYRFKIGPNLSNDVGQVPLPKRVLANSIMLNDKFTMVDSGDEEMYQYLGLRQTRQTAGTRTYLKRNVANIARALSHDGFISSVRRILNVLNLKKNYFEISYKPRLGDLFFEEPFKPNQSEKFIETYLTRSHLKNTF